MLHLDVRNLALLLGPLVVLGFVAGAVRAYAQRPGLSPRRRRILDVAWVLLLLAGAPIWLVFAVALGVW